MSRRMSSGATLSSLQRKTRDPSHSSKRAAVHGWIQTSSGGNSGDEDEDDPQEVNGTQINGHSASTSEYQNRDLVAAPSFDELQEALSVSSPIRRIAALDTHLIAFLEAQQEWDDKFLSNLVELLSPTSSRWQDKASNRALIRAWRSTIRLAEDRGQDVKTKILQILTHWAAKETTRMTQVTTAAKDQYNLLCWILCLIVEGSECRPVIESMAESLSRLLMLLSLEDTDAPSQKAKGHQRSLHYAHNARRRCLLLLKKHKEIRLTMSDFMMKAIKTSKPLPGQATSISTIMAIPLLFVPLLTIVIMADSSLAVEYSQDLSQFWATYILPARPPLPSPLRKTVQYLIQGATIDIWDQSLRPSIEKAFLRSFPDASLSSADLIEALPFQLQDFTTSTLWRSILNNLKSSNPSFREGSLLLHSALVRNVKSEDEVVKQIRQILMHLNAKTEGAEHRIALYSLLTHYSSQSTAEMHGFLKNILVLMLKETNDSVISAGARATAAFLQKDALDEGAYEILRGGLQHSNSSMVRSLLLALGELDPIASCSKQSLGPLSSSFQQILSSVLTAGSGVNVVPTSGFIATALLADCTDHDPLTMMPDLLQLTPKPSFFLSERIWNKITERADVQWFLRASRCILSSREIDIEVLDAVAKGFLQVSLRKTDFETIKIAQDSLAKAAKRNFGRVSASFRKAIEQQSVGKSISNGHAEDTMTSISEAKTMASFLRTVARCADEVPDDEVIDALKDCSLTCHLPIFEVLHLAQPLWIQLIVSAKREPANVVANNGDVLIAGAQKASLSSSSVLVSAAEQLVANMTLVSAAEILPRVLEMIWNDLDPAPFAALTEDDMAIYDSADGELVFSPIKKVATEQNRHLSKDQKWEADLRASLAKRSGNQPKYTDAEQAAIKSQLEQETSIRNSIKALISRASRSLGFLQSIALRARHTLGHHLAEVLMTLVAFLKASRSILSEEILELYLHLASFCTERIASISTLIGIATLRAVGVGLGPHRAAEDLSDQISRILYRIHFASETLPLPDLTFAYLAPLLNVVIECGGFGDVEDTRLEQLTLVMEIIARHAALAQNESFPRFSMVQALVATIERYPKLNKAAVQALKETALQISNSGFPAPREISLLLAGLLSAEGYARRAYLEALQELDLTDLAFPKEVWIACYDDLKENAAIALQIWDENALSLDDNFPEILVPMLAISTRNIQLAVAKSIAGAVQISEMHASTAIRLLRDFYCEKARPILPEYDRFGLIIQASLEKPDPWQARLACAHAIRHLAAEVSQELMIEIFRFLIEDGAMADKNDSVSQGMLSAGLALLDARGRECTTELIAYFEKALEKSDKTVAGSDTFTENLIILYGSVAKNLAEDDTRIPNIVQQLIQALKTPSEVVQSAVADCLPPLVKSMKTSSNDLIEQLLHDVLHAPRYAERRGAAYGLAGAIRGRGLGALKDCQVIARLREAADDKKEPLARQGAIFAFETLFSILGRLFEPYIVQVLPILLSCFGDPTPDVREATNDASKVIMSKISGHGVKLILPSLLAGLEEKQWRTKKGSIELLGAMAYCAPKQLSVSLPSVIPRLTEVLTDSHPQVRAAANKSLRQFGEVISNPEIQSLVNTLLKAMIDPATKTQMALQALINTAFVHYIDSPSLALIVPILERGLKERSAEVKRKAAQIVGNMASLTDPKDLIVYLKRLVPLVRDVLVDPVPTARATAAKALGTLVEKLGESNFPNIVDDLFSILKSDASGVDRQGAAQGLSEVLAGLGIDRLEDILPEVVQSTSSARATVREGFISLLVYLPATFGARFANYLNRTIEPVLRGLADESDYVRDASMRAGRMIVANYSNKAVDMLLPELEKGLFHENHRIRHSSIQLVGDLLFRVSGISSKSDAQAEDDEGGDSNVVSETTRKALLEALGSDRRDRILSSIFIIRQDSSGPVRLAAVHIWKSLVSNTPKTVKEMLPVLMSIIIRLLAMPGEEQQQVSSRTLGELVKKLGESILQAIMPLLRSSLSAEDLRVRQGVCMALNEMITTLNKNQLADYDQIVIESVRDALMDPHQGVRQAAARTFDTLYRVLGSDAAEGIVPSLLLQLQNEKKSEMAIQALKELIAVRPTLIFPMVSPTLTKQPLSSTHILALEVLAPLAGVALSRRLPTIIAALISSDSRQEGAESGGDSQTALKVILKSVTDDQGINSMMMLLLGWSSEPDVQKRQSACLVLRLFLEENKQADMSEYRVDWLRQLVSMLEDRDHSVVQAASSTLATLSGSIPKVEMDEYVIPARRAVENVGSPGHDVPGFNLPNGIASLLPIFLQGLLNGNVDQREHGAFALGHLAERTSPEALKPFVTQMTGPLIRIIGDRYPSQVKIAILVSLTIMLKRVPQQLRPFLPQLQRTFVKSLYDANSLAVRVKAIDAFAVLMELQTRVDPVVSELVTNAQNPDVDQEIRETLLKALAELYKGAGGKHVSEAISQTVLTFLDAAYSIKNAEEYDKAVAKLTAAVSVHDPENIRSIFDKHIFVQDAPTPPVALTLMSILEDVPETLVSLGKERQCAEKIKECLSGPAGPAVQRPAREARVLMRQRHDLFDGTVLMLLE